MLYIATIKNDSSLIHAIATSCKAKNVNLNGMRDMVLYFNKPLCSAIEKGKLDAIKALMDSGINTINDKIYATGMCSCLEYSIGLWDENISCTKLLLSYGPDINERTFLKYAPTGLEHHYGPLYIAYARESHYTALLFILSGANIEVLKQKQQVELRERFLGTLAAYTFEKVYGENFIDVFCKILGNNHSINIETGAMDIVPHILNFLKSEDLHVFILISKAINIAFKESFNDYIVEKAELARA